MMEKVSGTVAAGVASGRGAVGAMYDKVSEKVSSALKGESKKVAQGSSERKNRAAVWNGTVNKIEIEDIGYPLMVDPKGNPIEHAVIIKIIASAICGSDLHMLRGRTGASSGTVFGHEFTGEIVEKGRDVKAFNIGDTVSVPFNVGCGYCMNCKNMMSNYCINCGEAYGAYGFAMGGGWRGGQAEYNLVPHADYNLLKFPDVYKDKIMEKMCDLALLTDILPTAMNGATKAGVGPGSTVYIAGAGPVGICCAASCFLRGAAVVIVGDVNPSRLPNARLLGCHTIDLSTTDTKELPLRIADILGVPEVDCAVDCVGFECCGNGSDHEKQDPSKVLSDCIMIVHTGGKIAVPGVYVSPDPRGVDMKAKAGIYPLPFAMAWTKAIEIVGTGQCPVVQYNHQLMMAIFHGRLSVAKALNVDIIGIDDIPRAYEEFNHGTPKKFIVDPHGLFGHLTTIHPPVAPAPPLLIHSVGTSVQAQPGSRRSDLSSRTESEEDTTSTSTSTSPKTKSPKKVKKAKK